MDKTRLWLIGSVLVTVLVVVGGVLLGIQPQLAAAAAATEQRNSVAASNAGQAAILDTLKRDFKGLDALKAELAPLKDSVPAGTRMSDFVGQIDALAAESQVTLTGLTVADAVPYAAVAAPAEASPADPESEPGSEATPAPSATAAAPAGLPPVTSDDITGENFASLAVTVTVTGNNANALNFVSGLQTGKRLFLLSGLVTTRTSSADGGEPSGDVTATISGLVYALVPPAVAEPAPVE